MHLLKCQFLRKTIAFTSHLHSITCSISNLWKWRKDSSLPSLLPLSCKDFCLVRTSAFTLHFSPSQRLLITFSKENLKIWVLRVMQYEMNVKMFQSTSVLKNWIPLVQILTFSWSSTWTWYNRGNIFPWKKKALHKMCKKCSKLLAILAIHVISLLCIRISKLKVYCPIVWYFSTKIIVVIKYWKIFILLFRTAKTSNMSKQLPVVHFKTYLNSNFSLLIIVGNPSFPKTPRGVSHVAANEFHWKLWKRSAKLLDIFQMLGRSL